MPLFLFRAIAEVRAAVRGCGRVGFVPTMGALHAGHLSLMRAARAENDFVVASIFVNPRQFGPHEDFEKYPRPLARDRDLCATVPIDALFAPTVEEMYPPGYATTVSVAGLQDTLCGRSRPGHFDGVTTVVAKLFHVVGPCAAYFGQKDAQQATIIARMVADQCFPVTVRVMPIVREADGLAMSSRNVYLTPAERAAAPVLRRALLAGAALAREGERSSETICRAVRGVIESSETARIDYVQLVNVDTLREAPSIERKALLAVAARFGATRLIDNACLSPGAGEVPYDA
ncbi:MAG: pantoate--beta-alanine ligase [Planctomycetes bacterium]|nr:pantoate--beta-alanine ligase [Planctomycetota bacterium]